MFQPEIKVTTKEPKKRRKGHYITELCFGARQEAVLKSTGDSHGNTLKADCCLRGRADAAAVSLGSEAEQTGRVVGQQWPVRPTQRAQRHSCRMSDTDRSSRGRGGPPYQTTRKADITTSTVTWWHLTHTVLLASATWWRCNQTTHLLNDWLLVAHRDLIGCLTEEGIEHTWD